MDDSWNGLRRFLGNPADKRHVGVTYPMFSPSCNIVDQALAQLKVLVVGAGGLGCEILKGLAMMGFKHIDVIDMDRIDVSNLNRQFLFRSGDVGKSKAEVAASIIQRRMPTCVITAHNCRIEEKPSDFYSSFHAIICGLDSIPARRWLNAMICSNLEYSDDGSLIMSTMTPIIDGGTEGFKGNARVILPGLTPCIECTLELYPPQVNFPLCTVAHTPRLPEHCVEYARVLEWEREKPFSGVTLDGDNPEHITWILERAQNRAQVFGITGVDYRLAQGVVKRIIPAVSSTNAVIAAVCVQEVFKLATNCSAFLDNYVNFQALDGTSMSPVHLGKSEDCLVCSNRPRVVYRSGETTLKDLISFLTEDETFQLRNVTIFSSGRLLYSCNPALVGQVKGNAKKLLCELLGGYGRHSLIVSDDTRPNSLQVDVELGEGMG